MNLPNGAKYLIMDQVKFVEDSLQKTWWNMVCLSRTYILEVFMIFARSKLCENIKRTDLGLSIREFFETTLILVKNLKKDNVNAFFLRLVLSFAYC